MKVNLGCADMMLMGFVNVDCFRPENADGSFLEADLSGRWPFEDSSVELILAYDIIEHLLDKIHTMNEAWRVLAPGGRFDVFVPTTDGRGADQDPTHRTYWNRNSFFYHTVGVAEYERFHRSYGITGGFKVVSEEFGEYPTQVSKLKIMLEAVKP